MRLTGIIGLCLTIGAIGLVLFDAPHIGAIVAWWGGVLIATGFMHGKKHASPQA